MSEDRYTEWLGRYVDGNLNETERRQLESHLAACESCRTLAEDLLNIGMVHHNQGKHDRSRIVHAE